MSTGNHYPLSLPDVMRENGTGGAAWVGAAGLQKMTENYEYGWILPFTHSNIRWFGVDWEGLKKP